MLRNYSKKKEIDDFKFGFDLSKMSLNTFLKITSFKENLNFLKSKICHLKTMMNHRFSLPVPSSSSGF
jgi:hypothetical protein